MTFLPWPLGAAALALLFGTTFHRRARPVPVVVTQAAYEIYLIVGVTAAAAFACARGKDGFRALLAGAGGAPRSGWIAVGTASAWLMIAALGSFFPRNTPRRGISPTTCTVGRRSTTGC